MPLKRPAAFQMNDALPGIQAVQMMLRRHERQQRLIVRMSYKIIAATALFFRSGRRHQFELTAQIHPFTENSDALFRFFQEKEGALNQGSLFKRPAIQLQFIKNALLAPPRKASRIIGNIHARHHILPLLPEPLDKRLQGMMEKPPRRAPRIRIKQVIPFLQMFQLLENDEGFPYPKPGTL